MDDVRRRVRQGLIGFHPRIPPDRDDILDRWLTPALGARFRELPPFDQAHLIAVWRVLHEDGERDPDLLVAALLHDIGKSDGPRHVRLLDRVARVLLRHLAPGLLHRLAQPPPRGWRAGLVLSVHHPALGAEIVRSLGGSDRVVYLIAHHEDEPIPADPDIRKLANADVRSIELM